MGPWSHLGPCMASAGFLRYRTGHDKYSEGVAGAPRIELPTLSLPAPTVHAPRSATSGGVRCQDRALRCTARGSRPEQNSSLQDGGQADERPAGSPLLFTETWMVSESGGRHCPARWGRRTWRVPAPPSRSSGRKGSRTNAVDTRGAGKVPPCSLATSSQRARGELS